MKSKNSLILLVVLSFHLSGEEQAYLLDTGGMRDPQELLLVGVLQGLVNRERPLLYLSHASRQCPGAANTFARYLTEYKKNHFTTLAGLPEAITTFRQLRHGDGSPMIRGLVRYEPDSKRPCLPLIAANFSAQEDLLPVTAEILSHQTPLLSGEQRWTSTDAEMGGWNEMFTHAKRTPRGLRITAFHSEFASDHLAAYRYRWVDLDLDRTPKLEITVTEVDPGGKWGLAVDLASVVNPSRAWGTVITRDRTDTGVFLFDLAATGKFDPRRGRASIQLCSLVKGKGFTVSRVRLLQADGFEPKPIPVESAKSWSEGLPVLRDLRDVTAFPELATEEGACRWSIEHFLPKCPNNEVYFARPISLHTALDRVIARKVFVFYQELTPYKDAFPNLELILGRLTPPAIITGGLLNESSYIHKLAVYGHRQASVCENLSFWSHVPADPAIRLPQVREAGHLEPKVYVNFSGASGDVMQQQSGLMAGLWTDPGRGTVPVTWGINPLLADWAPALIEYYGRTASPKDSFWAGPSGAGYTAPSAMPEAALKIFAAETRRCVRAAGLSPAVDYWDSAQPLNFQRNYTPMIEDLPSGDPPIALFSSSRWKNPANVLNYWTNEGVPLIIPERSLFGRWEDPKSGVDVTSDESESDDLADRIKNVADKRAVVPLFLTLNIRWRPQILAQVAARLPSDRFQVVGMPDFIALAQEAGRLAVKADVDGIAPGGSVGIDVAVRNPTSAELPAGIVSWQLPVAWGGSQGTWKHPPVMARSLVRYHLTLKAPVDLPPGPTAIIFDLDQVPAKKHRVELMGYADSRRVVPGNPAPDWKVGQGATVRMTPNGIIVMPATIVEDHWRKKAPERNGEARISLGKLDLARGPVVDIDLQDNDSHTRIYLDDGKKAVLVADTDISERLSIDVAEKTGWKGQKEVSLVIAPGVFWGRRVTVAQIDLHHRVK